MLNRSGRPQIVENMVVPLLTSMVPVSQSGKVGRRLSTLISAARPYLQAPSGLRIANSEAGED